MDNVLSINAVESLTQKKYGPKEWLNYYRNSWQRNVIALTIDVQDDIARTAADKTEDVVYMHPDTQQMQMMPVEKRLEFRKGDLARALATLNAIDTLFVLNDEELASRWTPEALAPTPEKAPAEVVAGVDLAKDTDTSSVEAKAEMPDQEAKI